MFSPKNLLIHLFYVLIVVGLFLYGAQDSPLIGNMTMALIALDLAILVKENSHVASKLLLTPFWLFFYPNTFFMVTQLTTLQLASNTLWEQSSLILFMYHSCYFIRYYGWGRELGADFQGLQYQTLQLATPSNWHLGSDI